MNVAMIAPVGAGDAIAEYARELASGLASLPNTEVQIVALPSKEAIESAKSDYAALAEICSAPDVEVVHLHHAHRLFGKIAPGRYTFWDVRYLLKKPIVITAHDTRSLEELLQAGQGAWWERLWQRRWLANAAFRDSVEIAPFVTSLTIVHTAWERQLLIGRGAKSGYLTIIPPGIAALPSPLPNVLSEAAEPLESGITRESETAIGGAWPTIDDPYAVERELAWHRPVLAPDTPTTREIVARIPCLELYNPTTTEKSDRNARRDALLSDLERREKLTANARRYAQRFGWPRVAALTRNVYRDAMDIFNNGPHHGSL